MSGLTIKLRSKLYGVHVHESVFVGPDAEHLALAGMLRFRVGEWQIFGACLGLGADQLGQRADVMFEGDDDVVAALAAQETA